jgi:hypothetical protein
VARVTVTMMSPYLIRTRTEAGETVRFGAVFTTKQEAIEAVRSTLPVKWIFEAVVGEVPPAQAEREKLGPGKVVQLSGR